MTICHGLKLPAPEIEAGKFLRISIEVVFINHFGVRHERQKVIKPISQHPLFKLFLKPLPPKIKKDYTLILDRKAGTRFQYYYHLHREKYAWRSVLTVFFGLICLAIAVFFAVMPGPAIPFWFIGALLISSQLLIIARLLDKIESAIVKLLQDETRRRVVGVVLMVVVFVFTIVGMNLFLGKFLPKPVTIAAAVICAVTGVFAPYKLLVARKKS